MTGGVNQYPETVPDTESQALGFVNLAHVGSGGEEGTRFMLGWADPLNYNLGTDGVPDPTGQGVGASQYYAVEVDSKGVMYGDITQLNGTGWGESDPWTAMEASGCIAWPYAWYGDTGPGQKYSQGYHSGEHRFNLMLCYSD